MPAKPKPLKAKEPPPRRDPGVPDRLWALPLALQQLSEEKQFFQKDAAKAAGVEQSTVSRWLSYKGLAGIAAATIVNLEEKLGLDPGSLLPRGITLSDPGVSKLAGILSIDQKLLHGLKSKELGAAMQSFPVEARKAIMGVVHVYGVTLERAVEAVESVMAEYGRATKSYDAPIWFERVRTEVLRDSTGKSGTHISVGKIPIAKPSR